MSDNQKITTLWTKHYDYQQSIPLEDIPLEYVKEGNWLEVYHEEGHYSENNSYDSHTIVLINTKEDKTQEELDKEEQERQRIKEYQRAHRYNHYLRLKKEFEQ